MTSTAQSGKVVSLDPGTHVGIVSLTVSDLDRSLGYYTAGIGLQILSRQGSEATLGPGGVPLLVLKEQPGAREWPRAGRGYTGLYHLAILLPTRADLGRWLRHWIEMGNPVPGQGDHLVSEALYLEDPDLHGIEIYRDRPRNEWIWDNGRIRMGTGPIDIRGLIDEANLEKKPWEGMPAGTCVGHIHLQVGDIVKTKAFYQDVLGFDVVAEMPTALFMSAGGYHHHVGANTWHSLGAGSPPETSVRLTSYTIELPNEKVMKSVLERLQAADVPHTRSGSSATVNDPWDNTIVLQVESSESEGA